jgi:hypothetical protein
VGERGEMEEKKSYVISEFVRLRHKLTTENKSVLIEPPNDQHVLEKGRFAANGIA